MHELHVVLPLKVNPTSLLPGDVIRQDWRSNDCVTVIYSHPKRDIPGISGLVDAMCLWPTGMVRMATFLDDVGPLEIIR